MNNKLNFPNKNKVKFVVRASVIEIHKDKYKAVSAEQANTPLQLATI